MEEFLNIFRFFLNFQKDYTLVWINSVVILIIIL